MSNRDDFGLSLPLQGVQLLEASAGTGKTFALATLYARWVIERGLPVTAILVVTFTEAATQELRDRLRLRLLLAQRLAEASDAPTGAASPSEEERLTLALLQNALACESRVALQQRLCQAIAAMDLAPIYTIHGFCRRALADHALEAGQPLSERELIKNEVPLREEVATEFWRQASRAPDSARTLRSLWDSPAALAKSLSDLLALDVLLPLPNDDDEGAAEAALKKARETLARQFLSEGDRARRLLREAFANKTVNASLVKDAAIDLVWQALAAWAADPLRQDLATEKLKGYSSATLEAKTNKGKATPTSPLFDAIGALVEAQAAVERAQQQHRIAMIHAARDFARQRLTALKRERGLIGYDDMIGGVAEALASPTGEKFAERLQAQYRIALIDEFQDTDARQWAIFRRLFAPLNKDCVFTRTEQAIATTLSGQEQECPRALFLIGDPKQAIYRFRGGDVFTYLDAAQSADHTYCLQRNFRSRPSAIAALQALFQLSGPDAFAQAGIDFEPVESGAGCADDHFLVDDAIAPALNLLVLAENEEKEAIDATRTRATTACVAAIHTLLTAGLAGRASLVDKRGQRRAVAPGDIAVLVEKNAEAAWIQQALARLGIPSVMADRGSLYQTEEAQHLRWLLAALGSPGDDERLRAALAAPLFGLDAAAIAAFAEDEASLRVWQDKLQVWRRQTEHHGPLALIDALCAERAGPLLTLIDGERRLSNYLQLAEALQEIRALSLDGLLNELDRRILDADGNNDDELLRSESDAARVKILTLHKSKGLEFELVFLPYAATNGTQRRASAPPMASFHDGRQRVAKLFPGDNPEALQKASAEERAEKIRLLYVGQTRARLASWLVWGAAKDAEKTALAWLLHREPGELPQPVTAESIATRFARLATRLPSDGILAATPAASRLPTARLRFSNDDELPPAALARRVLNRDWWVYSFSQLVRDQASIIHSGNDEAEWPLPEVSRFSGARFGNCLHAVLERTVMAHWRNWVDPLPPPQESALIAEALREHGYVGDGDLADGTLLLTRLVAQTLNVRLPEGTRLAWLAEPERRREMEFHLALPATAVSALLEILHRHGVIAERRDFGQRQRLEGLLTGFIDLVYEADGRYYLLDYKSNQLPEYAATTLAKAVRDNEYDLQYVLYSLALHRWLRFRLGQRYDYSSHMGGVRYLFCRGLDAQREDSPGIYAPAVPRDLIESLDALFCSSKPTGDPSL